MAVLAFGAWHVAAAGFASNKLAANLVLLLLTSTLARALQRRSRGQEVAWFGARMMEDPTEGPHDSVNPLSADFMLILAAVFFVGVAAFQP